MAGEQQPSDPHAANKIQAAHREASVEAAKEAAVTVARETAESVLANALAVQDPDGVVRVLPVPRNSVVVLPDPGEKDRARVAAEMAARFDHDSFAVAFAVKGAVVAVHGPDALVEGLRATMADEVHDKVMAEARRVAAETASTGMAAHTSA